MLTSIQNILTNKIALVLVLSLTFSLAAFAQNNGNGSNLNIQATLVSNANYVQVMYETSDYDIVSIDLYGNSGTFVKKLMKEEETLGYVTNNRMFFIGDVPTGNYILKAMTATGEMVDLTISINP